MEKEIRCFLLFFVGILFCSSFVSSVGGIGIKWSQESIMIDENGESCLSYSVYNPWADDSYVIIGLEGDLLEVLVMQEKDSQLIPAYTSSSEAIPVEFCFKVPKIYHRDCALVDRFLCELKCEEETKVYEGDVVVSSAAPPAHISATQGSATQMAVSAPLRVRVACNPHPRNYTLVYVLIAAIAALIVIIFLVKKYRKPKVERDREKLRKLRAEIAKESKGKRKTFRKKSKQKKK